MKTHTLPCLLAALGIATSVLAGGVQIATGDNMQFPEVLSNVETEMLIPVAVADRDSGQLE